MRQSVDKKGTCRRRLARRARPFLPRQAHWVVNVKGPSRADTEAAFSVFGERALPGCVAAVPQLLVSVLVKTLGAAAQALHMRAACARCVAHLAVCLSRGLEPGGGAPPRTVAAEAGAARPQQAGAVSLEGLCREPGLLDNLYSCLKAGNDLIAGLPSPKAAAGPEGPAAEALAGGGGGSGGRGAAAAVAEGDAAELAEAAAKAIAALLMVSALRCCFREGKAWGWAGMRADRILKVGP
jgi:hypothetical protein